MLYGLLPPLLYAAALSTSLLDIKTNRAAILSLSVGLVLFTALGVGVVAWLLLPIPFALALALGAIVAPPDAVAATSVARRIGLPRRITTILEGESLLNDATALVSLRTALAAAGLAAHGAHSSDGAVPEVTVVSVSTDLVVASVGGIAVGVVAYLAIGALRRHLTEVPGRHGAVVRRPVPRVRARRAGRGLRRPRRRHGGAAPRAPRAPAPDRALAAVRADQLVERHFVLENAVFLLIGLQIAALLDDVGDGRPVAGAHAPRRPGGARHVPGPAAGLDDPLHARQLPRWPRPARPPARCPRRLLGRHARRRDARRGAHPAPGDPLRAELVVIALVVTVGTLLLQGATLPMLARALDVAAPTPARTP